MAESKYFFAVDLGATSGRTIIGSLADGKFDLEELTRFDNNLIETGGHFYWDIYALYFEIIKGLKLVAQRGIHIKSIGIDTWGCDFVFIGKDNAILRNPLAYRDPHTFGMMEKYFDEKVSKAKVYEKTGIQFMNFNSPFQIYAMRKAGNVALENADKILFIPDALSFMLTGKAICEYTVASTSQILNPATGDLDTELVESLDLKREQFGEMTAPATIIGTLTEEVQKMTGLEAVPVIAVAGHDTASAVAAVPAKDEKFAYLSSGTWSLMGIETQHAIINDKSYDLNFTNEGGIEGITRFLKNICGMWIYERCRKEWKDEALAMGKDLASLDHGKLIEEAMTQPDFQSLINPDDAVFANPSSMVGAILEYCEKTHQHVPQTHGEFCSCIFESLALRYRQILEKTPISLHCWQADDVVGFERGEAASGGIQSTGNYPGKARNIDELRQDIEKVQSLLAGTFRLNLHEIYGEFGGKQIDRDEVTVDQFTGWMQWAKEQNMKLDFNSTSFSHPKSGSLSLSNPDPAIREFWIEHTKRCRRIADAMGKYQNDPCIMNIWVHDGSKDLTVEKYEADVLAKRN